MIITIFAGQVSDSYTRIWASKSDTARKDVIYMYQHTDQYMKDSCSLLNSLYLWVFSSKIDWDWSSGSDKRG